MACKRYDFVEILEECNKKHKTTFKLSEKISKATIIHSPSDEFFQVSYKCIGDSNITSPCKKDISDFVYYNVSTLSALIGSIKDIIWCKEEGSLNLKIEVWPPSKIRYAYLEANYFSVIGNLGQSCMRKKEMQKALNFYVKNKTKIVVVVDNANKIHARALLWDNVRSVRLKKPFTYLDRVYTRSDTLLSLFYDLATANGWKRYPSTTVNVMNTNYYKRGIDATGMCYLPYNDTFRYLHLKKNLLTSSTTPSMVKHLKCSGSCEILNVHNNSAYYPHLDPNRTREAISGNYISKKDAIFVKRYDAYVSKKNITDMNGAYYSILDDKIVKTEIDGYILKEDSVAEVLTNKTISKNNAVQSTRYEGYIHKSNIIHIWDEIYHKSDNNVTCFDNKWYHISQCFVQDGSLIPKGLTLIVYNLEQDKITEKLEYKKHYLCCSDSAIKKLYVEISTGEFILNTSKNKQHLKKFSNKWYIKQDFKFPDKNQLLLFGDKI